MGGYAVPGWTEFPQDYKVDAPPTGYANHGGYGSAYVWDNPPPPGSSINFNYVGQMAAPPTVPISTVISKVALKGTNRCLSDFLTDLHQHPEILVEPLQQSKKRSEIVIA